MYVVYDRVAEESGPVFEAKNDGVAVRKYRDLMDKSAVSVVDYRLLLVGVIDHLTSRICVTFPPIEVNTSVAEVVE